MNLNVQYNIWKQKRLYINKIIDNKQIIISLYVCPDLRISYLAEQYWCNDWNYVCHCTHTKGFNYGNLREWEIHMSSLPPQFFFKVLGSKIFHPAIWLIYHLMSHLHKNVIQWVDRKGDSGLIHSLKIFVR